MTSSQEPLIRMKGEILNHQQVGKDLFHMLVDAADIAAIAIPGQFIEIATGDQHSMDPLLRRAISIYSIDKESGSIGIVYRVVGRGTQWLSGRMIGEYVDLFGPVGNGFVIPESAKDIILVGGGIGMPPLYGLAKAYPDKKFTLYYGAQTAKDIILLEEWKQLGIVCRIATDDGSMGFAGRVTDLIRNDGESHFDICCACGPKPMLKAVQNYLAQVQMPGLLSLEERMACGVGACLGCVCKTRDGYRRVCVDGPVFSAEEVVWE